MRSQKALFLGVLGGFLLGGITVLGGVIWYMEHRFGSLLQESRKVKAIKQPSPLLRSQPSRVRSEPILRRPAPLQVSRPSPPFVRKRGFAGLEQVFPKMRYPKPRRPLTAEEKAQRDRALALWKKKLQDPRGGLFVHWLTLRQEEAQVLLQTKEPLEMQRLPGAQPSDAYDAIKLVVPRVSEAHTSFYGVSLQLWMPSDALSLRERWMRYQKSFPMERRPLSSKTLQLAFWSLRHPLRYLVVYEPKVGALLLMGCHTQLCKPTGMRHLAEFLVIRLRQRNQSTPTSKKTMPKKP